MPVSWWALYGRINASLDYNFTGNGKLYILPHPATYHEVVENVSQNLPVKMM